MLILSKFNILDIIKFRLFLLWLSKQLQKNLEPEDRLLVISSFENWSWILIAYKNSIYSSPLLTVWWIVLKIWNILLLKKKFSVPLKCLEKPKVKNYNLWHDSAVLVVWNKARVCSKESIPGLSSKVGNIVS